MAKVQDNQVTVTCPLCQNQVTLHLIGGQRQYTYEGMCSGCGQYWSLDGEDGHEEGDE